MDPEEFKRLCKEHLQLTLDETPRELSDGTFYTKYELRLFFKRKGEAAEIIDSVEFSINDR